MVCLGNKLRSFCHFWDCVQVLHFRLFCCEGYSISSKGFLPTSVDLMVIWIKFAHSHPFPSWHNWATNTSIVWNTFYLSIHQLLDIGVVSTFWLLWIVLLWIFTYRFSFKHLYSVILGIYLGVKLLIHMVTPYSTFWGTAKLFSKVATPFAVLPTMYVGLCSWLSSAGDCNARDSSLIPRLGRSPGEGNGNPLQYSCPGNPMDRGAWQATVHGVVRVGHDLMALPHSVWMFWFFYILTNICYSLSVFFCFSF